jgi:hypothetical protein
MAASIPAPYGLDHTTDDPADLRTLKANLTDRDAIPATSRHEGLTCYVTSNQKYYQLIGGIANSNWKEIGFTSGLNEYLFTNDLEFGANGLTGATAPIINDVAANIPAGNYLGYVYSSSGTAIGATIIRPTTGGVVPFTLRVDKCIIEVLTRIQFQATPTDIADFTLNTGISIGAAVGQDNGVSIRLTRTGATTPVFQAFNRNTSNTITNFTTVTPVINTWYDCKITINPNTSTVVFTISNGVTTETITHTTNFPPVGTYQWQLVISNNITTRPTTFRTFLDFYGIRLIFTTPRSNISI